MTTYNGASISSKPLMQESLPAMDDLMLIFKSMDKSDVNNMLTKAKREFVLQQHHRAVSYNPRTKLWRSRIYENGKRKDVTGATEEKVFEKLYDFYKAQDSTPKTLSDVFALVKEEKASRGRVKSTIGNDERFFGYLSADIQNAHPSAITGNMIKDWLRNSFFTKATQPIPSEYKKMMQVLNQVFRRAIREKLCVFNPVSEIVLEDYMPLCRQSAKTTEQQEFSLAEREKIRKACYADSQNPRNLVILFSEATGVRMGEGVAIHTSDIKDTYIFLHRQQVKDWDEDGHQFFKEVLWTKDEKRKATRMGRKIPITPEVRKVIELALQLPGTSEYLFHDYKGQMIKKDGVHEHLHRLCKRLGTVPTHNHAFRKAKNSEYIILGVPADKRAGVLGHSVEVNERNYSLSHDLTAEEIATLMAQKMAEIKSQEAG